MSQAYAEEALTWIGVKEIKGPEDNPLIVHMFDSCTYHPDDDETAWCSAFVNMVVHKCGDEGSNSAAAASWAKWGKELETPEFGCIVVLPHHVAFFICDDTNPDYIQCLGGNQSDSVKASRYKRADVVSYRDVNK